jgi:hypothetical protein
VAGDLHLKAEYERLRAELPVFKQVLPLMEATRATKCELPGYARGRLQAKVAQTFRNTGVAERKEPKTLFAGWRLWALRENHDHHLIDNVPDLGLSGDGRDHLKLGTT